MVLRITWITAPVLATGNREKKTVMVLEIYVMMHLMTQIVRLSRLIKRVLGNQLLIVQWH